jgi:hypothetical protein
MINLMLILAMIASGWRSVGIDISVIFCECTSEAVKVVYAKCERRSDRGSGEGGDVEEDDLRPLSRTLHNELKCAWS